MKFLSDYIALIGADAAHFADALAEHCDDVLLLPPCSTADRRIACHPDTLIAQLGDQLFVSAAYLREAEAVFAALAAHTSCQICACAETIGRTYPADVGLNLLTWENFIYAKSDSLWREVVCAAREQGRVIRPVRQGYAGCAALACGKRIFSADPSILRAVRADGAEAVALSPGGIELAGYGCGFIGGAAGYAAHTAVFFGDAARHPDGRQILSALEDSGVRAVALADAPLSDFGGIRFLRRNTRLFREKAWQKAL